MQVRVCGVTCSFSFWFFAVVACTLLWDGGTLAPYLILPVVVHELGHLAVMFVCGMRLREVHCRATGISIRRDGGTVISYTKELAVCLGGIAANILFALILYQFVFQSMRVMFLIAVNLALAIFNLAPIGDLDGGQIIRLAAERFFSPEVARTISRIASVMMLAVLFGLAIFLIIIRWYNPTLLIACAYLTVTVILRE